jgi:hypothetical protein
MEPCQGEKVMPDKNKPAAALKRLDALVGKWVTELRLIDSQTKQDFRIIGTDAYQWLPGEFFLVHEVDVRMDGEPYQVTEFIGGYDDSTHTYPMRSFDSQGNFQTMQASIDKDGVWTFAGETTRATLTVGRDGSTMTAHWDQTQDGSKWSPWMDMKFTKIR